MTQTRPSETPIIFYQAIDTVHYQIDCSTEKNFMAKNSPQVLPRYELKVSFDKDYDANRILVPLFQMLTFCNTLVSFTLMGCDEITDENIRVLLNWLQGSTHLTELSLDIEWSNLDISTEIFNVLKQLPLIKFKLLTDSDIDLKKFPEIKAQSVSLDLGAQTEFKLDKLAQNSVLTSLEIFSADSNVFSGNDIMSFIETLSSQSAPPLIHLDLCGIRITDVLDFQNFCADIFTLMSIPSLERLYVPAGSIEDVPTLLRKHTNLQVLHHNNLCKCDNQAKCQCAEHLATILTMKSSLKEYRVCSGLKRWHKHCGVIANAFEHNHTIERFDLPANFNIGQNREGIKEFSDKQNKMLERNRRINQRLAANWMNVCMLTAFIRANYKNELRFSALPLLVHMRSLCELSVSAENICMFFSRNVARLVANKQEVMETNPSPRPKRKHGAIE